MYKVFVNEKKLTLSETPVSAEKVIQYEDASTLEMAVDLLENTSCADICIYNENLDTLWKDFIDMFKIIEAAGGVVKNKDGNILFIFRLSKWDLPKGKIEKGESLENAALREIEEETGLSEIELQDFISSTYHLYTERNGTKVLKTTHWFRMKYLGTKQPVPQIEEGISKVEWKNDSQIVKEVLPSTFRNIQLILGEVSAVH